MGAQWLSGRVLDSRLRGRGFEPHWRYCVVSLSKNINPSLVLVQTRKTHPFIIEKLMMGRKESISNKQNISVEVLTLCMLGNFSCYCHLQTFAFFFKKLLSGTRSECQIVRSRSGHTFCQS